MLPRLLLQPNRTGRFLQWTVLLQLLQPNSSSPGPNRTGRSSPPALEDEIFLRP